MGVRKLKNRAIVHQIVQLTETEKGPVRSCAAIDVVYTHINGSTGEIQTKA
jgi:hypothetical protein